MPERKAVTIVQPVGGQLPLDTQQHWLGIKSQGWKKQSHVMSFSAAAIAERRAPERLNQTRLAWVRSVTGWTVQLGEMLDTALGSSPFFRSGKRASEARLNHTQEVDVTVYSAALFLPIVDFSIAGS